MALRFFADHCVSNQIIDALREAGHEVVRLKDYLPTESPDALVIAKAQELDAILLSLNGDFADIVTYPPARFKGIVALQVLNHPEATQALIARLMTYFVIHPAQQYHRGKLIIVEAHRVRIRE
jgi:predicted nuclease of predicted toxin-antitoxin system